MIILNIKNIMKRCRISVNDISIDELIEIIKANTNIVLFDVRSPQEFKEGHLNGAINIPIYELEKWCNNESNKNYNDKTIIVYCQSGIRSKKAIKILNKNGFTELYHLKDGLDGI